MNPNSVPNLRRCKPLLGTFVEIQLDHIDQTHGEKSIENAFAVIEHIHLKMSRQNPNSDLYQTSKRDPMTKEVLHLAKVFQKKTHGIFNINQPEGMTLDGIAKGFAVDKALNILSQEGGISAMVNAGGDMACFGKNYPIHIRHKTTIFALTALHNKALAASSRDDITVAVEAPTCVTADALTKVVLAKGKNATTLLHSFNARAWIYTDKGIIDEIK